MFRQATEKDLKLMEQVEDIKRNRMITEKNAQVEKTFERERIEEQLKPLIMSTDIGMKIEAKKINANLSDQENLAILQQETGDNVLAQRILDYYIKQRDKPARNARASMGPMSAPPIPYLSDPIAHKIIDLLTENLNASDEVFENLLNVYSCSTSSMYEGQRLNKTGRKMGVFYYFDILGLFEIGKQKVFYMRYFPKRNGSAGYDYYDKNKNLIVQFTGDERRKFVSDVRNWLRQRNIEQIQTGAVTKHEYSKLMPAAAMSGVGIYKRKRKTKAKRKSTKTTTKKQKLYNVCKLLGLGKTIENTTITSLNTYLESISDSKNNADNDFLLTDTNKKNDGEDLVLLNELAMLYKMEMKKKTPNKTKLKKMKAGLHKFGLI